MHNQSQTQERLWNRNYCKVMTANFLLYLAFFLLTPLFPLYLNEHFGATKDMIGVILSGYTLTALIMRPFSGYLVDSFPRKAVLLICFALYFICFAGYLAASTLLWFFIVRTIHGGPFGAATVANSTIAIDVLPSSRRQEGVGYYGLSNNIATAIAPTVGLAIYQYTENFNILFWLSFALAGVALAVNSTLKIKERELIIPDKKMSLDRFFLLKGWAIAANILFFGFCYGCLSNYLAIYSKEVMGIVSGTGLYFMLLSIGLIVSRLTGARALREGKMVRSAAIGVVVSSVAYLLFVACPNYIGYYGSAILIGLGNGHFWPAFQNMMLTIAHKTERGTANSTLFIAWDSGFAIGILAGGVLSEHISYAFAFWTIAIAHIAGAAMYLLFTKKDYIRRVNSTNLAEN